MFYSAKMKYDESDNLIVRASRSVTDRVEDAFGMCMYNVAYRMDNNRTNQ